MWDDRKFDAVEATRAERNRLKEPYVRYYCSQSCADADARILEIELDDGYITDAAIDSAISGTNELS